VAIHNIYVGNDARSHVRPLEGIICPFGTGADTGNIPVDGLFFVERTHDTYSGYHNAPYVQFIFVLAGEMRFQTADADPLVVRSGDVVLVEDTYGEGHVTRGQATIAFARLSETTETSGASLARQINEKCR
jgi:hypothetical protein